MKVIKTHDGLIGLDFDKQCDVIWCNNLVEALPIMHANFNHMGESAPTKEELWNDLTYAVDHMAKTGDTIAEFGIFGTFMYTTKEDENAEF